MDPTLDILLTFGPVPLTGWVASQVTGRLKIAIGPRAETPAWRAVLPFVPAVVGTLTGLVPGFLPGDRMPPVLLGMVIGFTTSAWYDARRGMRKARARRLVPVCPEDSTSKKEEDA